MSRVNKDNRLLQPLFPVIMLSGDMDPVGNYSKGVTKLYNIYKKQNIDVKIKLYKDARHEILNDFCKDEVRSDILNFIEERIK
jgi:alpha-beta hydrolase superfamily lysophospholipase